MTEEEKLAEVEDLLRSMPPRSKLHHNENENFAWLGRVSAVLIAWNPMRGRIAAGRTSLVHNAALRDNALNDLLTSLHEARHDLTMRTAGPSSIAIAHGRTFQYFDELRKIIETATADILFIDPYLDAEFVSRYLGNVREDVALRLLTTKNYIKTLVPAVEAYTNETPLEIQIRLSAKIHDRFVFIDRSACYQSGASFKDGARKAPTAVTQIHDAFDAMFRTYESFWDEATVVR